MIALIHSVPTSKQGFLALGFLIASESVKNISLLDIKISVLKTEGIEYYLTVSDVLTSITWLIGVILGVMVIHKALSGWLEKRQAKKDHSRHMRDYMKKDK